MGYFFLKPLISRLLVAAASEIARRHAGFGALIASLPLVSVLGIGCLTTFLLYTSMVSLLTRFGIRV